MGRKGEGEEPGSSSRSRQAGGRDRMLYKLYDFYLRASFELEPNKMAERECGWERKTVLVDE